MILLRLGNLLLWFPKKKIHIFLLKILFFQKKTLHQFIDLFELLFVNFGLKNFHFLTLLLDVLRKLLDLLLLVLNIQLFALNLLRLTLNNLSVSCHLFIQFLFKSAHQSVHHDIAVLFNIEIAAKFAYFSMKLGFGLLFFLDEFIGVTNFTL